MTALASLIAAGASSAACTQVHVHESDGKTRIEQRFGIVSIERGTPQQAMLVYIEGIGLSRIQNDLTLGWHRADFAVLPHDCHLIVWARSESQVRAAIDALQGGAGACVTRASRE